MDALGATEPTELIGGSPQDISATSAAQRADDDHGSSTQREDVVKRDEEDEENESEDDNDDEEPQLKYAYLTKHLGSLYRNGDATSAFLTAGDKMVCCPRASGRYPD